jgi:tetratricopeptide (TPR) repeat protein
MERLGDLFRGQGDFSQAMKAFARAREICQGHNDQLGTAHFSERMALVYNHQENFERAVECFREALTYYEEHRVADRLAFVLSGLGDLEQKMGQSKEALAYLGRALQIYNRLGAGRPAELVAAEMAAIEATLEDGEKGDG